MNFKLLSAISAATMLIFGAASCNKHENDADQTKVSLDRDNATLAVGETLVLNATVTPESEAAGLVWTSDNEAVATVENGTVTAVAAGTAVITASVADASATCTITVSESGTGVESITLDKTTLSMQEGDKAVLKAEITPADAVCTITWTSSDEAVATVSDNGEVSAIAEGSATITAAAGNASATCAVTVTKKQDLPAPQAGDFYYSDGTWSTSLNSSKEVIGIVFWTGDPTRDDKMLQKDHPDCTNGLVVSIKQGASGMWQEKYDSYSKSVTDWAKNNAPEFQSLEAYILDPAQTGLMLGYNNTKAIEAFNAAPENSGWTVTVIEKIQEFRKEVPAPASTSDWYLPSVKELHLLCAKECDDINLLNDVTNRNFINTKLGQVSGADLLPTKMGSGEGFVKTSTEGVWYGSAYPSRAYAVIFENGDVGESSKTFSPSVHRAVLAF